MQNLKQIGPQRYRESFGRYYEDFQVGDVYEHRPGKTVLESDNHLFTLLTLNTHPLHFDAEYGKATEFGRNLVVSTYTLALLIGMSVSDVSQKAVANLGMDEVRFTAPVFAGDTLYAESEVLAKRASKSRPGQGIVTVRTLGKNQRGEVVCAFRRDILIPARGEAVPGPYDGPATPSIKPTLVASTARSRCPPDNALPTNSSLVCGPYASAVSMSVMPRSSAWWITAMDVSSLRGVAMS